MPGPRKNRNKFEISAEVLKVAMDGAKKTHIMYGANLSFDQLEKYLTMLLNRGMLTREPAEAGIYSTTDVGRRYLREFVDYESSRDILYEKTQLLQRYLHLDRSMDRRTLLNA